MITGNNLLAEYPRISQNILPKELQQQEFDFFAENFDLIDGNEVIGKCADTFIELLNDVPDKQNKKLESAFTRRDVTAEVLKKAEKRDAGLPLEKTFNMIVMGKHKDDLTFKAIDIKRGAQVNNLLYASLIRSDKPDSVISLLEKQPEEWQLKIIKAGKNQIIQQSGKDRKDKPSREPTPKKVKPKPENEVTELPSAVVFIKAYCGRAGKVKTKTQVYTFIKKLQKAIAEKKIRKTSEYAPQIEYIKSG